MLRKSPLWCLSLSDRNPAMNPLCDLCELPRFPAASFSRNGASQQKRGANDLFVIAGKAILSAELIGDQETRLFHFLSRC